MTEKISVKSRCGVSLVEEVCAVAILIIAVIGLLATIGFAHTNTYNSNTEDGAAAQAQQIADKVVAALSANTPVSGTDILNDSNVGYRSGGFSGYTYAAGDKLKQYTYSPADVADSVTGKTVCGYNITVRVYYGSNKKYVNIKAYASDTGGAFN